MVTGHDDRRNAVNAIGLGAYDFFEKPIDPEILAFVVERAARVRFLEDENRRLEAAGFASPFAGLIAASPKMLKVCRAVEKLALVDATTLILGESGTGKEVLVRILHTLSARAKKRLVAINCAAIPEALLESELFGYEKGAYTGAAKTTPGKIETADGGSLFHDEIGDLLMPLQAKLPRFLQERVVERLGGRREIPVDVRVICATHQDIPALIREGRFREDLYYRINEATMPIRLTPKPHVQPHNGAEFAYTGAKMSPSRPAKVGCARVAGWKGPDVKSLGVNRIGMEATIHVPPLRERTGDAVVLARAFLTRIADQQRSAVRDFTHAALEIVEHYAWPGNVRELENRVKRAVIMADGGLLAPEDLELVEVPVEAQPFELREVRELAELRAIQRALAYADNNMTRAAELLGVTRPTLYNLWKRHGFSL